MVGDVNFQEDGDVIRSELIQIIADENPHLYQRDVERIVNTVFDESWKRWRVVIG